jgi:20S proteasome subunit beta 1
MAVAYEGGVIIGADSRTSTGALRRRPPRLCARSAGRLDAERRRSCCSRAGVYISNRASDKVTAVDERIFVCRSGSAADTQAVSDYVTYFLDQHRMEYGKAPKVETAANLFRELCYNNKNMLTAGILVAGWDPVKGGQVYSIPVGGALLERPYSIGGSGSTYIYGFCDAYFKPGMSAAQSEEFVVKALSHAMARDGSSGGLIRTVKIDAAGAERKMVPGNKLPFGPL